MWILFPTNRSKEICRHPPARGEFAQDSRPWAFDSNFAPTCALSNSPFIGVAGLLADLEITWHGECPCCRRVDDMDMSSKAQKESP